MNVWLVASPRLTTLNSITCVFDSRLRLPFGVGVVCVLGAYSPFSFLESKEQSIMDFNNCVTEYNKGNVVIEDVLYESSWDGTEYDVTLCGPYGVELSSMTLNHIEFDHLQEVDLKDCNFLRNEY